MKRSNHTEVPNEFFDNWLPKLKGSEIQVFLVICRQTRGWHKETDKISISQLEEKTGLSNRCLIDASRSLKDKGLVYSEIKNGIKSYEIAYEQSSQIGDEPMNKVHTPYEQSSQIAYEQSSHTKETITKETKQNKVATNVDDDLPDSCEFIGEARKIAQHLKDIIVNWDPSHKYATNPPAISNWVLDIERAIRLDGRTPEQLNFIIEYIYTQSTKCATFWAGNIESGKKLREHFDKIKNQIKKENNYGQRSKIQSTIDSMYESPASVN